MRGPITQAEEVIAISLTGTIIFLASLAFVNYWLIRRSVVYPPFVFTCVWLLDVCVFSLHLSDLDPLHALTLNVICIGALLFSIGGALSFLIPLKTFSRVSFIGPPRGRGTKLKWLLIAVLFLGVSMQFRYLLALAASAGGGGFGFLAAARQTMIDETNDSDAAFRWFTYITTWTVFSALLFQLEPRSKASRIMLALSLLSCLASTGRGQFLLLLSALTTLYLIRNAKERFVPAMRFARWPIIAFVSLFVILMFSNKDTSHLTITPAEYVQNSIVGYLCGSMVAFDLVVRHLAEFTHTGALPGTLAPLFRLLSTLGLMPYAPPPTFEAYVFVPVPINTFTVYKAWIVDFGLIPGMMVVGLVGFLHSLLYRIAMTANRIAIFLFSLSVSSAILVFFVDTYSSFSFYAHALVFATIFLALRSLPSDLFPSESLGTAQRSSQVS